EGGRLPGAAPEVINVAAPPDLGRKAAQQRPVQGLVREFVGEPLRVLPRDRVVTSPDVIGRLLHWTFSGRTPNSPAGAAPRAMNPQKLEWRPRSRAAPRLDAIAPLQRYRATDGVR